MKKTYKFEELDGKIQIRLLNQKDEELSNKLIDTSMVKSMEVLMTIPVFKPFFDKYGPDIIYEDIVKHDMIDYHVFEEQTRYIVQGDASLSGDIELYNFGDLTLINLCDALNFANKDIALQELYKAAYENKDMFNGMLFDRDGTEIKQ